MRQIRKLSIIIMLLAILWTMGCAANKYQIMYGVADWYYTNHITLQAQYDNATDEQKVWLRKNMNPYMNMMQQAVIAMGAIDAQNDLKLSACITEIGRIATGVKYDVSRLVVALRLKDWDTMETEVLALKSVIIQKLSERR
jgi:hypothetical protein